MVSPFGNLFPAVGGCCCEALLRFSGFVAKVFFFLFLIWVRHLPVSAMTS